MLSRLHLIPKRCGQTEKQTDKIAISRSRVIVLMRDKKCCFRKKSNAKIHSASTVVSKFATFKSS